MHFNAKNFSPLSTVCSYAYNIIVRKKYLLPSKYFFFMSQNLNVIIVIKELLYKRLFSLAYAVPKGVDEYVYGLRLF